MAAATMVIGALDAEMKAAFGISHFDHALLLILSSHPRRQARMGDIARSMNLEPSNISHRVKRLERAGLLERRPDPADGRATYARLTPRGMRLLRDAWPVHRDGIRRHFLDHIDPARLDAVAEVFGAICESKLPAERRRGQSAGASPS